MQQRSPRRRAPQARAASESSPWKPSPERAREREVKREAVILAAARCFRERGYHHSSLDDIAALLNVTKPTIYYYVANKEEILFECFRSGLDQIQSVFPALKDSKDSGRLRLLRLVERYVEAVTSEFGWCMVRAEDQDLSPAMSGRIRALKSQIDQCMRQLIREGIADGSIARCDPEDECVRAGGRAQLDRSLVSSR